MGARSGRRPAAVSGDPALIGARIADILRGDDAMRCILDAHGCGYLDGGCLVLADALVLLLGGSAHVVVAHGVGLRDPDRVELPSHALAAVGDLLLDADGAADPATFIARYRALEGIAVTRIVPLDRADAIGRGGMIDDPDLSRRIADLLARRLVG